MKRSDLKRIIKEEVQKVLKENKLLKEVSNPLGFNDNPYKNWYVNNQDKMLAQDARNALSSLPESDYLSLMRDLTGPGYPSFNVKLQDTMDRPEMVDSWINRAQAGSAQELKDLQAIKTLAATYKVKK